MKNLASRFFRPYLGLGGSVYTVMAGTMVNRFGDFVFPFLTLYATQIQGMDPSRVGLLVSIAFAASAAGALVSGRLADSWGKKEVLLWLQGISGVMMGLSGFFLESPWAFVLILVSVFFKGASRPVLSALVADLAPQGRRAEVFTLQYWSINVGVAVGPLVAAFLFRNNTAWLFFGDGLTTLISVFLLLWGVKAPKPGEATRESHRENPDQRKAWQVFVHQPLLWGYGFLVLLNSMVYAQTSFGLPLKAEEVSPGQGPELFGFLLSLNAVIVLVFSLPLSRLLKKSPPLSSISLAGGLFAAGLGMLAFPSFPALMMLSTFVWTAGEIFHSVNSGVYVSTHTPVNWRGSIQSFLGLFTQAGQALSPLVFGLVLGSGGMSWMWAIIGMTALLHSAAAFGLRKYEKSTDGKAAAAELISGA